MAWSGQAVAAVAGRGLNEGLGISAPDGGLRRGLHVW